MTPATLCHSLASPSTVRKLDFISYSADLDLWAFGNHQTIGTTHVRKASNDLTSPSNNSRPPSNIGK